MNIKIYHNFHFNNAMEIQGWLRRNPHRTFVSKEKIDGLWYICTNGDFGNVRVAGEKKKGKKK